MATPTASPPTAAASSFPSIAPPEPSLTPAAMMARATALRKLLRGAQAECEAQGRVTDAVNAELIRAGFYRVIQPRCFGGYEFDVPTFHRIMMEIARGCTETGWVVALTAGHPLILANFSLEGQRGLYGKDGELRCPAAFNPPGTAVPVAGGYRVTASWPSASGCDLGTHHMGSALVAAADGKPGSQAIQAVLERAQYAIVDDWHRDDRTQSRCGIGGEDHLFVAVERIAGKDHVSSLTDAQVAVMGMQGTGSKRVVVEGAFVPTERTILAVAPGRGSEPMTRPGVHQNPMYLGRIASFLISEAAAVAVGAARGALDLYEELIRVKRTYQPPYHERFRESEYQAHYGRALGLVSTAEAALIRAAEDYMDYARAEAAGDPFSDEKDCRLLLIELHCIRLATEAVELIYRTAGTSDTAKNGAMIGRIFRNLAVISTHPALQLERTALNAARLRFGLLTPHVKAMD